MVKEIQVFSYIPPLDLGLDILSYVAGTGLAEVSVANRRETVSCLSDAINVTRAFYDRLDLSVEIDSETFVLGRKPKVFVEIEESRTENKKEELIYSSVILPEICGGEESKDFQIPELLVRMVEIRHPELAYSKLPDLNSKTSHKFNQFLESCDLAGPPVCNYEALIHDEEFSFRIPMRYEKSPDPSAVSIPVSERLQNILDNQTFARVSNKFSATKWGSHIALDLRKLSRGERPLYSTKETPYVLTFLKEFTENPLKYGQLTESVGLPKQNDVFIVKTPLSALYSILESGHKTAESLVRSVKEEFGETFTEAQLWEAKNRRWEYFEGLRHPA